MRYILLSEPARLVLESRTITIWKTENILAPDSLVFHTLLSKAESTVYHPVDRISYGDIKPAIVFESDNLDEVIGAATLEML